MSGQFLLLAGLATTVIDGLDVVEGADWGRGDTGDYDSALLRTRDGQALLVRRATLQAAQELRARSAALAALTDGMRARLSFAVPVELGVGVAGASAARAGGDAAGASGGGVGGSAGGAGGVGGAAGASGAGAAAAAGLPFAVYGFIPGENADRMPLDAAGPLTAQFARAIAEIHALPKAPLVAAHLENWTAADERAATATLVRQAEQTGKLPQALSRRWGAAVADDALWEFVPSVVHGSLERGSFLVEGDRLRGVLGWSDLRVGDPAVDLRWVQSQDGAVMRALLDEYTEVRGASVDRQVRTRAQLYGELELARWLLLGVRERRPEVVADAEQLLDDLVNRVRALEDSSLRHDTLPVLDLDAVQALLAEADLSRHAELRRRGPGPEPQDAPAESLDEDLD